MPIPVDGKLKVAKCAVAVAMLGIIAAKIVDAPDATATIRKGRSLII